MGNHLEILANYAMRRFQSAPAIGRETLAGLNRRVQSDTPKIFCAGNDFWQRAAVGRIVPTHPPEHFEPQHYPAPQPTYERQGE